MPVPNLESFIDEQAIIEYAMLWDDTINAFKERVTDCGFQIGELALSRFTITRSKLVLESEPEDGLIMQAWGLPTIEHLIGQVSLSVQNAETKVEQYCYELLPERLTYYGRDGKRTRFDRDEIEELRADFQERRWDNQASQLAASNALFFDV